jgi:hypothetical protein
VEAGVHKTPEGMIEIRDIKDQIDTGRKFSDQ